MGTKVLDWKSLIGQHPKNINATIYPLELDKKEVKGELGQLKVELDIVPAMMDPKVYKKNRLKLIFKNSAYIDMTLLKSHPEIDPL